MKNVLTVGQLRQIISGMDDSIEVVIGTEDWFTNVEALSVPDDDCMSTLTLYPNIETQIGNWDQQQLTTRPSDMLNPAHRR